MNDVDQELANKLLTLYQMYQAFGDGLAAEDKNKIIRTAMSLVFDEPSQIVVPEKVVLSSVSSRLDRLQG